MTDLTDSFSIQFTIKVTRDSIELGKVSVAREIPPDTRTASGTEAAKAVLAPPPAPAVTDRWARDRKGVEQPNPEGCEALDVELSKLERKEDPVRMRVTFPGADGKGFAYANCFDEKLFPYLAARIKQRTRLHIVRSGKYLNVVGVGA